MKIAFLLPNLKAGGGNRSQIMLANGLSERGHDVSIIVPRGLVSSTPMNVKVKVVETGLPLKDSYLSALLNHPLIGLKSACYEAVIITFALMAWTTFLPCCLLGTKRYLFARHYDPLLLDDAKISSAPLLRFYKSITRLSYKLPLKFIVNSEWTGRTISENISKHIDYTIVHNGVDLSVFNNNSSVNKQRRPCKKILTLGKQQKWKGFDDLLAALKILTRTNQNFELVVMTPDTLGTHKDLPFSVQIIKPKTDREIADTYRSADVFVSASWYEGFCNPPLEAMACGTPVVVTDSGGVREYAVNNHNCLMTPPKEHGQLASSIERIITDNVFADNLAQNGLKTARKFTWGKSIELLEKILTG